MSRSTDATDPLEQYEPKGYAFNPGDKSEREVAALDAAVALTASGWGPAFDSPHDDATGEWWIEGYDCARLAVESAVVDALRGNGGDGE